MEDSFIKFLISWGQENAAVRAMILTSTRAVPGGSVDRFSDYDVILVVDDVQPYYDDRGWLGDFGKVLVVYRDPLQDSNGYLSFAYITQYEDGLKIDFTLWPVDLLKTIASTPTLPEDLDVGYRVLLDKDELCAGLTPPTYRAHIPSPPEEEKYLNVIEEFFHEATYVAKHLRRDDLIAAKYNLDYTMKFVNLRKMLEWYIEIDHDWSVRPGAYGRGLKKLLDAQTWQELLDTYCGAGIEENWGSLFKTIKLFRRVAMEVGNALGYNFPDVMDKRVDKYLQSVKNIK